MATYQAYLGLFNAEAGSFLRHSYLGEFSSREDTITAYERERTEISPHLIVAKMDDVIESDAECQTCGGSGLLRIEVITE